MPRSAEQVLSATRLQLIDLIVHGVFYLFWREPELRAGIGIEAVSVDIVVGDNRPAGAALTPGESSIESSRVDETKPTEAPVEKAELAEAPAVKAGDARGETVKEQATEPPKEQEPERQKLAMVETPQAAEIPTVRPRETPPDAQAVREQPKKGKPEPKQKKAEQPKPEYRLAGGRGESTMSSVANYNGLVSAHLRRFQTIPGRCGKERHCRWRDRELHDQQQRKRDLGSCGARHGSRDPRPG